MTIHIPEASFDLRLTEAELLALRKALRIATMPGAAYALEPRDALSAADRMLLGNLREKVGR